MTIKFQSKILLLVAIATMLPMVALADNTSNRKKRKSVRSGNSLYEQKRYSEAEVEYKKALEANPSSEIATYNLALSLLNQADKSDNDKDKNSPVNQASQMLSNLAATTSDQGLASRAYYNLGNIAFEKEQYDQSIEMYKNCLRRNPNDDDARENLRLAQKKKQQQEQQQQNQQNQDNQKQEEKENKEQQDKQDKQQEEQEKQQQQQNQSQQQQQQQQGMSQESIDQILKAMQDAEQNTQQRVNEEKAKEEKARIQTDKNW